MQRLLNGKLTTCRNWPCSPQYPLEGHHSESLWDLDSSLRTSSWPRQTSFEPCTNVSSCVRARRPNFLSSARALESVASTTFCECTATRSCKRNEPLKSTTRLDRSLLKGSSRDSQRTAWSKRHSERASLELDTKEGDT